MSWEISVVLSVGFMVSIFAYLGINLDKDNVGMKYLLFFGSLFGLLLLLGVGSKIADASGTAAVQSLMQTGYSASVIFIIVVLMIFLVNYLKNLFGMLYQKKNEEKL